MALALAAAFVVSGALASEAPEGPRLAIARFLVYPKAWSELSTIGLHGGNPLRLVGGRDSSIGPSAGARPSWSPDGSLLAFTSAHGAGPEVFVVGANGSGLRRLPGTLTDDDPVFSPNGHEVAFSRLKVLSGHFERPGGFRRRLDERLVVRFAIWAADLEDGSLRALTPWRRIPMIPTSFSPDGKTLAVTTFGAYGRTLEALAVRLDGSGSTLLARNALEPVYSPDGGRVAFIRFHERRKAARKRPPEAEVTADLYVVHADGSEATRLTHDPSKIELWPSWDPSGQRLAYTRFRGSRLFLVEPRQGDALMQINADGTCPTKILSAPGQVLYGSAWQPGSGREAGRIECGE